MLYEVITHVSALEGPLDRGFDKVLYEYISNFGRIKEVNVSYNFV